MVLLVASLCWAPGELRAWPVFDEGEVLGGVRVFPDHEDPRRFWYVEDHVEPVRDDGRPAFSFERFRYLGGEAGGEAGNEEAPWGRGVLTFRLQRGLGDGDLEAARRILRRRAGRNLRLDVLPPAGLRVRLVYAAGEGTESYDARGEAASDAVWRERAFAVGLAPRSADLLWQAFVRDGVALSVAYELEAWGLPKRPDADPGIPGFEPGDADPEPETVSLGGDAFELDVSPKRCPDCFRSTDLDAEIPAGYATVAVFCHDFDLASAPDDLAGVEVQVKAFAATGDRPVESRRFLAEGERRGEIHFPFAVSIDAGYEFRKIRIFKDGHVEAGEWTQRATWNRLLDITEAAEAHGSHDRPDPRDFF